MTFTNQDSLNNQLLFMTRAEYESKASGYLEVLQNLDQLKEVLLKAQEAYSAGIAEFASNEGIESWLDWEDTGNYKIKSSHPLSLENVIRRFCTLCFDFNYAMDFSASSPTTSDLLKAILNGEPFHDSTTWLERLSRWDVALHQALVDQSLEKHFKIKSEGGSEYVIGEFVATLLNIAFEMNGLNQVIGFKSKRNLRAPNSIETPWFDLRYTSQLPYEDMDEEIISIDIEVKDDEFLQYLSKAVVKFSKEKLLPK